MEKGKCAGESPADSSRINFYLFWRVCGADEFVGMDILFP